MRQQNVRAVLTAVASCGGGVMTLHISDTTTLQSLHESFSALFPFLRLELVDYRAGNGDHSHFSTRDRNTRLCELSHRTQHAELSIDPDMTVEAFERSFYQTFGLRAVVLRRSGRVWLKTMMTDDWTLGFQNEQGRVLSE